MAGTWKDIAAENRRASMIQRVARATAWEYLEKPKPTNLSRVPPNPEALTPEYLTAILCRDVPGAKVTAITLGAQSSGSGDRCAFTVAYNEAGTAAGLPVDLFHKGFNEFYTRLHNARLAISPNEPAFYEKIRPGLPIEAPTAWHAELEPRTYRLTIILDDVIKTKGASFYEIATPIARDDLDQMVRIIATLHGTYWESDRLETEFTWLQDPLTFANRLIEGMELRQLTHNGFERAAAVLPPNLAGRFDEVWSAFLAGAELSTKGPLTYLHGDPHLRNFYKTADGVVGLADWQVTMRGSWTHDFVYTMLTGSPLEARRGWERDLLATYLKQVAASGGTPPSQTDAWELVRRQTMYTFVGWLVTIGYGALQPSMQPDDESLEIIRRAAAAVEDYDSIRLLNA
jgi:hypothetical protein